MNADQRRGYFRRWAAACAAQGWDAKDEALRRDATLEATGVGSSTRLTDDEISKLFRFLERLADPVNLQKAIDSDPETASDANRRRQLTWVIREQGFADSYVATCAKGLLRSEGKAAWAELSAASLEKLRNTVKTRARQRDATAAKPFAPRSQPYHQRPETKERKAAERQAPVSPRPGVSENTNLLPF